MYSIINKNIVVSASAINILTYYIARILAPLLILVSNFYNDSFYLLVLSFILILLIYINNIIKEKNIIQKKEEIYISYYDNMRKGFKIIASSILLRNIFYLCFAVNLFLIPFGVLIPFLVVDILKEQEEIYSLLISLQSVGGILGALITAYYPQKSILFKTISGISLMFIGVLSMSVIQDILLACISMLLVGYGTSTYLSSVRAVIHDTIDESARNITSGLIATIFNGVPAIGALLIAFIGKYLGILQTLQVISLISMLSLIIYIIKIPINTINNLK